MCSFGFITPTELTPEEAAGKLLYTTGKGGTDTPVVALMSSTEVPATIVPCMNCHGENGKGLDQGQISPPDITWKTLSQEIEKKRTAYTEKKLKRAISMGLNPNGEALQEFMPRYQMTLEDMNNLIAYLKKL